MIIVRLRPAASSFARFLPSFRGLVPLVLVLDAHHFTRDGAHLHFSDGATRVAYVERIDEPPVLALKLATLSISGRTLQGRCSSLLHSYLRLARKIGLCARLVV